MKKKKSVNNAFCPKCGSVKRGSYELTLLDLEFLKKYDLEFMLKGKTIRDSERNKIKIK